MRIGFCISGLHTAKSLNIKTPFIDFIERFIESMEAPYPVEKSSVGVSVTQKEPTVSPLSHTEIPQPQKQEQTQSTDTSSAASLVSALGVLHICGYLMFSF
jgi:hypothetical protein